MFLRPFAQDASGDLTHTFQDQEQLLLLQADMNKNARSAATLWACYVSFSSLSITQIKYH